MHIPDGFLSPPVAIASATLSAGGLGLALHHVRKHLPPRHIPLMGLAAAFIFATQMLNFPVLGGTSGHLIGSALATILLGPASAVIIMTAVLILQCLMFADGGLTALGANVFNMAILAPLSAHVTYRTFLKLFNPKAAKRQIAATPVPPSLVAPRPSDSAPQTLDYYAPPIPQPLTPAQFRAHLLAAALAAWASTFAAALACAGQLAMSGKAPAALVLPAMAFVHCFVALGEALITLCVFAAILKARPELARPQPQSASLSYKSLSLYGLLLALGLALFVSPFACSWPDGLESVAETLGFAEKAPAVPQQALATAAAAAIGTLLTFAVAITLARILAPSAKPQGEDGTNNVA